jgi:uncharacterized protein (UPF0276 family)
MPENSEKFSLPELGVGIIYSSEIEPLLAQYPSQFDVVEVEPQTTWLENRNDSAPYRIRQDVLEHIAQLPGRKLVHSIGTPVGGTKRPDPAQLALLRRTLERFDAPWFSDHLSFNATPEFNTGFFLPPCQTAKGVETAVQSIRDLQMALPLPIAIETGVNYLKPRRDEMPDGLFVAAVAETANCGILLDLHNIFANSLNGRQTMEEFLAQIPLERVWEMHIAGGFEMDGFWLDAHSGAIPEFLLAFAKQVIPYLPNLKAIIFEIFSAYVPVVGLELVKTQVEKLHELWQRRGSQPKGLILNPSRYQTSRRTERVESPATWERALGALAIGHSFTGPLANQLAQDPGVTIINRLVNEFRAAMIVSTLRLASRLLMLTLGTEKFRALLEDFWSKTPPQQFASSEAEKFAAYLKQLDLPLPQLAGILDFEQAVLATLIDEQPRVVNFTMDPLPMIRSLAEGRLPEIQGQSGHFEIEVTPDGPMSATGLDLESVRQAFPFH